MTDEMTEKTTIDEDMTPEERLQWLRDRGVLVETPEERKASQVAHALRQPDDSSLDNEAITISYVLVPCDSSQPLQELSFQPKCSKSGSGGDLLIEHLKKDEAAFGDKRNRDVDVSLLQDQAKTLLSSSGPDIQVSDAALQQVAAEQSVETFCLVNPTPSNNYTGINMYLDEVGMLKRLPLNVRAKEYAARAGYNPPPTFYGNVYLGRIYKSPSSGGIVQNRSFCLQDTAMDAPWLQAATMENLQHQMEVNRLTGGKTAADSQQQQQPSVPGDDGISKQEDGFAWTQTEEELEVTVSLPKHVMSKQIKVQFRPKSLVINATLPPEQQSKEIVSIRLFECIDVDSCTWTLETDDDDSDNTKKRLVLSMEKVEAAFWPRIRD